MITSTGELPGWNIGNRTLAQQFVQPFPRGGWM
jgi:hypothetical protein